MHSVIERPAFGVVVSGAAELQTVRRVPHVHTGVLSIFRIYQSYRPQDSKDHLDSIPALSSAMKSTDACLFWRVLMPMSCHTKAARS